MGRGKDPMKLEVLESFVTTDSLWWFLASVNVDINNTTPGTKITLFLN